MDGFTLYAKVEAADLILALDELAKIHKANCKNSLERHEATAYVIYRGLQAIREEYALAIADAKLHPREPDTGRYEGGYRTFASGTMREDFGSDR